jgi:hypothetical protein
MTRTLPVTATAAVVLLCLAAVRDCRGEAVRINFDDSDGQAAPVVMASADAEPVVPAPDPFLDDPQPDSVPADDVDYTYEPSNRWWFRADYSLWWTRGNRLPPMVTTSPPNTAPNDAGVLGLPGTDILFGDHRVDTDVRHGGRINFGRWRDDDQFMGIEFSFMGMGGADTRYTATSQGNPILARPFYDIEVDAMASLLTAYPSVLDGTIDINTDSEMYSAGVLLRRNWIAEAGCRVDFLCGYRYFRFGEGLSVVENLVSTDLTNTLIQYGTQIDVYDSFDTKTNFHGGEIGLSAEVFHGSFSLCALAKLGIGGVRQVVTVDGSTIVTTPGDPPTPPAPGGMLALPTNMGKRARNDFALLPELGVTLNCQLTECLTLTFGYSFLYLTEVVRTGDQIDFTLNPTQFPRSNVPFAGQPRPSPLFKTTGLWAQGLNIGGALEF